MVHARLLAVIFLVGTAACPEAALEKPEPPAPVAEAIPAEVEVSEAPSDTFTTAVLPILERRCTPCHFTGGVMHAKLPFDEPETIHELNDKLFTRIKDPVEREVIRAFLAEGQVPLAE